MNCSQYEFCLRPHCDLWKFGSSQIRFFIEFFLFKILSWVFEWLVLYWKLWRNLKKEDILFCDHETFFLKILSLYVWKKIVGLYSYYCTRIKKMNIISTSYVPLQINSGARPVGRGFKLGKIRIFTISGLGWPRLSDLRLP